MDNTYTQSNTSNGTLPNGTLHTGFLNDFTILATVMEKLPVKMIVTMGTEYADSQDIVTGASRI